MLLRPVVPQVREQLVCRRRGAVLQPRPHRIPGMALTLHPPSFWYLVAHNLHSVERLGRGR